MLSLTCGLTVRPASPNRFPKALRSTDFYSIISPSRSQNNMRTALWRSLSYSRKAALTSAPQAINLAKA